MNFVLLLRRMSDVDVWSNKESGRNPAHEDLPFCCKAELSVTSESCEDFNSFMNPSLPVSEHRVVLPHQLLIDPSLLRRNRRKPSRSS